MLLNTKQVAANLSVTKMTVTRLVKKGCLTPINSDCKYFLFNKDEVESLKSKRKAK